MLVIECSEFRGENFQLYLMCNGEPVKISENRADVVLEDGADEKKGNRAMDFV